VHRKLQFFHQARLSPAKLKQEITKSQRSFKNIGISTLSAFTLDREAFYLTTTNQAACCHCSVTQQFHKGLRILKEQTGGKREIFTKD